jgi:hypothetical protein
LADVSLSDWAARPDPRDRQLRVNGDRAIGIVVTRSGEPA